MHISYEDLNKFVVCVRKCIFEKGKEENPAIYIYDIKYK